jgi:hypothetical protein
MAINNSTISVDVWTTIRSIIVAANPVVTNSQTGSTTLASVRASYNDTEPARPQIIIQPMGYDESQYKFGSGVGRRMINLTIECYHSSTLGIDQLGDIVANAVQSTIIDGIELVGITTDYAYNTSADQKYHLKTVTFSFDRE